MDTPVEIHKAATAIQDHIRNHRMPAYAARNLAEIADKLRKVADEVEKQLNEYAERLRAERTH